MCSAAQSLWNGEGRIVSMHGSPRNEGRRRQSLVQESSRSGSGRFHDQGVEFNQKRVANMLYTIAVVLIILWLLGLVTSYTMGGLIHVLLVIAVVAVLLRVISGRNPV
jgi:predicted ferric reductase